MGEFKWQTDAKKELIRKRIENNEEFSELESRLKDNPDFIKLREIEYKSRKLGENYAYNEIYNKKMLEFGNNHKPKTLTKVQYHYMISGFKEFADKRFVEYLDRESEISSEVFGLIQYDDFGGRVEIFSFNEGFSKEDLGQALEKAAKEKNPYFLCNNWIETLGLECGPNKICQEGKAWEKLTERDM